MWMAAIGGRKCMDFLFCGCAAGRLKNGLLKRFLTGFNETGIRADTAAAFAVAAPVQAPKNCLWSNTVYMRL